MPDEIALALGVLALAGLLYLGYRRDLADARLFAAIRRASARPTADTAFHHAFARKHRLFWKPCPSCGKFFGGHQLTGETVPHPDPVRANHGERLPLCPDCSTDSSIPSSPGKIKHFDKSLLRRARKD